MKTVQEKYAEMAPPFIAAITGIASQSDRHPVQVMTTMMGLCYCWLDAMDREAALEVLDTLRERRVDGSQNNALFRLISAYERQTAGGSA